jgi:hypothetical protein
MSPTSEELSAFGRLGAAVSWGNTKDRSARTKPARDAFWQKFLDEADGDPERAKQLRAAFYMRLSMSAKAARAERKAARS